jgi:nucleotidyltransferase substrate binding protein (TIGR01987 family)
MDQQDIRWKQRFTNFKSAWFKLEEAISKLNEEYGLDNKGQVSSDPFLDDIIKEGLIQRFEYTHELAWKVMKDFLQESGNTPIYGSKDATRLAFSVEILHDGEVWMDMIKSRNQTSHTYNQETADEIFMKIVYEYAPEFAFFYDKMKEIEND